MTAPRDNRVPRHGPARTLGLALLLAAAPGAAQQAAADAPLDLAFQPQRGEEGDFWRYFYFWKAGVSAGRARADLAECHGYAQGVILWARLPETLPADAVGLRPRVDGGTLGPVVGGLVFAMVEGGLTERIAAANLRKCMGFKNYRRYGLNRALWQRLNQGSAGQALDRQARIAAGPEPAGASLDP